MNRRNFLKDASASVALATLSLQIGAQEVPAKIAARSIPGIL